MTTNIINNLDVNECKKRLLNLDTPSVSDAMDSLGINRALHGIAARNEGKKIAGPVFTVQYEPFSDKPSNFQNAGTYIDEVPAGHIILINNDGNTQCTNWGDILTTKAIKQGIEGTIVNGSARDIFLIKKLGYPLFSKDIFMVSGKNRVKIKATKVPVNISGVTVNPNDWIFADDNGVLVIAQKDLIEVIQRAENVHETESHILLSIKNGISLEEAREKCGYSTPWIKK